MKRLPIVLSLVALVVLAASLAYWVLQLYQPPQRPLSAAPLVAAPEPAVEAAQTLFGGQAAAAVASNFKLSGVVAAGRESVAIISADGQPAQAYRIGREVAPGVQVSEVHKRYVMLSDGGVMKRIELPVDAKSEPSAAPMPVAGAPVGEPQTAPGAVRAAEPAEAQRGAGGFPREEEQAEPPAEPAVAPPMTMVPATPSPAPAPAPVQATPNATPNAVPVPPVQMPAPTRSTASPVNQPPVAR